MVRTAPYGVPATPKVWCELACDAFRLGIAPPEAAAAGRHTAGAAGRPRGTAGGTLLTLCASANYLSNATIW